MNVFSNILACVGWFDNAEFLLFKLKKENHVE
jgi:hypothetical protein